MTNSMSDGSARVDSIEVHHLPSASNSDGIAPTQRTVVSPSDRAPQRERKPRIRVHEFRDWSVYSDAQLDELTSVIERWIAAQRRRGITESTIHRRAAVVRYWYDYTDFEPFKVTSWRTVEAFVDIGNRAPRTRYLEIAHLHAFYLWAMREGLCRRAPTTLVERPRVGVGLPRPMTDTDVALALALSTGPMHAAIVLAATAGLRCIEIARVRWVDIDAGTLRIHGKGRKDRVVPLHPDAAAALEQLDRVSDHVFPWRVTVRGEGVQVSAAVNRFLRSIGVSGTAHQLRHWFGTRALAASGGDLRAVQDLMGHASPATTAIYTKLDPSRLAPIVDAITLPVGLRRDADGQPALVLR